MDQVLLGLALGFGAGIAPGPMLGLVITGSLRGGFRTGAKLAAVPLLSDAPIIALSLTIVAALPGRVLSALAVAGGLLVGWLGVQAMREARTASLTAQPVADRHLVRQGVLVNLLNPHPWLFWIGVGGPLLVTGWRAAPMGAVLFLVTFYVLIVGTKAAIAGVVAASRTRVSQKWYRRLLAGSGVLLLATGAVLVIEFAGGVALP